MPLSHGDNCAAPQYKQEVGSNQEDALSVLSIIRNVPYQGVRITPVMLNQRCQLDIMVSNLQTGIPCVAHPPHDPSFLLAKRGRAPGRRDECFQILPGGVVANGSTGAAPQSYGRMFVVWGFPIRMPVRLAAFFEEDVTDDLEVTQRQVINHYFTHPERNNFFARTTATPNNTNQTVVNSGTANPVKSVATVAGTMRVTNQSSFHGNKSC